MGERVVTLGRVDGVCHRASRQRVMILFVDTVG